MRTSCATLIHHYSLLIPLSKSHSERSEESLKTNWFFLSALSFSDRRAARLSFSFLLLFFTILYSTLLYFTLLCDDLFTLNEFMFTLNEFMLTLNEFMLTLIIKKRKKPCKMRCDTTQRKILYCFSNSKYKSNGFVIK